MSTKPVQPVIYHQLIALAVHPNGLPSRLGWACDSRKGESAHVDVTVNCPKCIADNRRVKS